MLAIILAPFYLLTSAIVLRLSSLVFSKLVCCADDILLLKAVSDEL